MPRDSGELPPDALERLRRALIARYGPDVGDEACAEAAEYAARNWARVTSMENPVGYLYRVGHSRARRLLRRHRVTFAGVVQDEQTTGAWFEPELPAALDALSEKQRVCLLLIVGEQWTYAEVAELLGISRASVQTHVDRAKRSLQERLGDSDG